jgi:5'-deoxynucleotidase YfbR-like HD superfamily hydrolase
MTSTTITTISNQSLDLLSPVPEFIHILDIAHGLALQCRFAGQIQEFYSVAQHSVLVSRLVPPEDAMWGLLHDASEAYINDLLGPVKKTPLLTGYRMIEARLMDAILVQFGLVGSHCNMPRTVRKADRIALATEFRDLHGYSADAAESATGARPCVTHIDPVDWQTARRMFMDRYHEIAAWRRSQ